MRNAPENPLPNRTSGSHAAAGFAGAAERALIETGYTSLRGVACSDYGGVIRLGGSVPSQYLKQVAFAAVCQVAGSRPVQNEIQVVPTTDARSLCAASLSSGWFNVGARE